MPIITYKSFVVVVESLEYHWQIFLSIFRVQTGCCIASAQIVLSIADVHLVVVFPISVLSLYELILLGKAKEMIGTPKVLSKKGRKKAKW